MNKGYTFKDDKAFAFGNAFAVSAVFTFVVWVLCLLLGYPPWAHDHVALLAGVGVANFCGRYSGLRAGAENG